MPRRTGSAGGDEARDEARDEECAKPGVIYGPGTRQALSGVSPQSLAPVCLVRGAARRATSRPAYERSRRGIELPACIEGVLMLGKRVWECGREREERGESGQGKAASGEGNKKAGQVMRTHERRVPSASSARTRPPAAVSASAAAGDHLLSPLLPPRSTERAVQRRMTSCRTSGENRSLLGISMFHVPFSPLLSSFFFDSSQPALVPTNPINQ